MPEGLRENEKIFLANSAGISLSYTASQQEAIDAYSIALKVGLRNRVWLNVRMIITNISIATASQNLLASEERLVLLALDLAQAMQVANEIFRALLDRFLQLAKVGRSVDAAYVWKTLDGMGRNWARQSYRKGQAEEAFAKAKFWQNCLDETDIIVAEAEVKKGKDWELIKDVYRLRGNWQMERNEWQLAAASYQEAVRMVRERGLVDEVSETGLSLAKQYLNQLVNPCNESERLAQMRKPAHRYLAML